MIKFLFLIIPTIFLIFSGVCCASSTKQKTEQETYGEEMQFMEKNYVQTFYDDFSGTKLDTKKWEKCPEWQRQDVGGYWKNDCSFANINIISVFPYI